MTTGWKLLTSDGRPPIQGGDAIDLSILPITLPVVACDDSDVECSFGYNFVREIETGFKIAGLWRTGRPNVILAVEAEEVYERGEKLRTPSLRLVRRATDAEIQDALRKFSVCFGPHADVMAAEQGAWWQALQRPHRNKEGVVRGLQEALESRGLNWQLREFEGPGEAR